MFNEMMTNFMNKGFPQNIEQSGANKVGDAVRAYFRVSFKVDKAGPGSDTITAAALTSTHS